MGGSYSVMLGCWFGGMRMGLRRDSVVFVGVYVSLTLICYRMYNMVDVMVWMVANSYPVRKNVQNVVCAGYF